MFEKERSNSEGGFPARRRVGLLVGPPEEGERATIRVEKHPYHIVFLYEWAEYWATRALAASGLPVFQGSALV